MHTQPNKSFMFLESDDHYDEKYVFKMGELKNASFTIFCPPFGILNKLWFFSKSIQQGSVPKLAYSETLVIIEEMVTIVLRLRVRSLIFSGLTSSRKVTHDFMKRTAREDSMMMSKVCL